MKVYWSHVDVCFHIKDKFRGFIWYGGNVIQTPHLIIKKYLHTIVYWAIIAVRYYFSRRSVNALGSECKKAPY